VLRGLHFQAPPAHLDKIVHCISGRILDAVLDLRRGSPTFGQHELFELAGDSADMVFIPAGLAHGFYTLSEESVVLYKTSRPYSPADDTGVRWDTAGIHWPDPSPILSPRDELLMPLAALQSPFHFERAVQ
jgi:dTDP-4-dehydrorhamnose 3,5-epimerase